MPLLTRAVRPAGRGRLERHLDLLHVQAVLLHHAQRDGGYPNPLQRFWAYRITVRKIG